LEVEDLKVLKKETSIFLILTFTLTYLLCFILWFNLTQTSQTLTMFAWKKMVFVLMAQLMMLIPAFSALILNLYLFKRGNLTPKKAKIFFYYFFVLTGVYVVVTILVLWRLLTFPVVSIITTTIILTGVLLIFILHLKKGWREEFKKTKISFGKPSLYLWFGLMLVGFYLLNSFLNCVFGFGIPVDVGKVKHLIFTPISLPVELLLLLIGFQMIIFGTIMGLPILFGEEFGWRIFLQERLTKIFGRVKGVLLLGVIWGLWHAPIIMMGHNYPGYPIQGVFLMTLYTVNLSILLGFAVFRSGNVWLPSFLHGINNQTLSYLTLYICKPIDPFYCFGLGLYGQILFVAVAATILLGFKDWRVPEKW